MVISQERSKSRRRRLLDAALTVFSEQGYSHTPIEEIARASETSKGGLYFHFPSKQALFLALLDESSAALLRRVEDAMATESDPLVRGEIALREVIRAFAEHRLLARLLLIEAAGAGKEFHERLNGMHEDFANLIAVCLTDAVRAGQIAPIDTELAARAWYGAVNQIVLRWLVSGQPTRLEDAFPRLRALLLFGVCGTSSEQNS